MATTKQPRLSDSAKNALRSQRRRLATEQADTEARRAMEARSVLNRQTQPTPITVAAAPTSKQDPNVVAFHRGVIPRCSAVLASQGLQARILADLTSGAKHAYTDFTNIVLAYPVADKPDLDVAEVSAILRGIIYHEGGHCEHTEPFLTLYNRYTSSPELTVDKLDALNSVGKNLLHYAWNLAEDQRMEMLTVEDSPRKAAYFAPMVIDMVIDFRPDDRQAAKDLHERVLRFLQQQGIITPDQAAAMPFDDAAYERQRVAPYPLIAWRRYLPRNLRIAMRRAFVKVHGLTKTVQMERCILRYIKATDDATAMEALVALAPLLRDVMTPPNDTHDMGTLSISNHINSQRQRQRQAPSMDDSEQEYGEGDDDEGDDEGDDAPGGSGKQGMPSDQRGTQQAKGKGDDGDGDGEDGEGGADGDGAGADGDGDAEGDADGDGEEGDNDADGGGADGAQGEGDQGDSDGSHGNSAGTGTGDHDGDDNMSGVDDILAQAKADAEAERNSDSAVRGDVQAFNQALSDLGDGSLLLPYHAAATADAGVIAQARNMAQEMVQAFHEVNTEHLPTWQEQQTRGVLNVGRYLTRQHGDREFFRCWADEVVPGRNLAVSVLLDYSGSMGRHEASLAATAYAMKAACDELEIPCTVVLWDHEATLLWDGFDRAESVPVICAQGGTNPHMALEDMPRHRHDKDAHIVLVMTDAQFSVHDNWLNKYRTEGTFFVGAVLGPTPGSGAATTAESTMAQMGFDRYAAMDSLSPLVSMLENAIIDLSQAL
jgi:hypothetical protein